MGPETVINVTKGMMDHIQAIMGRHDAALPQMRNDISALDHNFKTMQKAVEQVAEIAKQVMQLAAAQQKLEAMGIQVGEFQQKVAQLEAKIDQGGREGPKSSKEHFDDKRWTHPKFDGKEANFKDFEFYLLSYVRRRSAKLAEVMEQVCLSETEIEKTDLERKGIPVELDESLHYLLTQHTEGDAYGTVRTLQDHPGLEIWRTIARESRPCGGLQKAETLVALIHPGRAQCYQSLRNELRLWDSMLKEEQKRSSKEVLDEDAKLTAMAMMVPEDLKEQLLNKDKHLQTSYRETRRYIDDVVERRLKEPSARSSGTQRKVALNVAEDEAMEERQPTYVPNEETGEFELHMLTPKEARAHGQLPKEQRTKVCAKRYGRRRWRRWRSSSVGR